MSSEQTQADLRRVIGHDGYAEIDADQLDALPYNWLEEQGWSLAHKAGTSTYVVYKPRPVAAWGDTWTWADIERAEAGRVYFANTMFSRDSVASRVLDEAARRVDPPDQPFRNYRYGTFRGIPFRVDDSLRPDEVWMVTQDVAARVENLEQASNQTATGAMMEAAREQQIRRLEEWVHGDGDGSAPEYVSAARPDHYRVGAHSLCVCGFESVFLGDMEAHLADTLVEASDGIPRRWRVCERCRASALCREVVVAAPSRIPGWAATFDPNRLPGSLETARVYRCDDCTRGL